MTEIYFLQLGGSLITDKDTPNTARLPILKRLAEEIATARTAQPDLALLIGHGSGSFGHVAAKKHGTRAGVQSSAAWLGFAEVWQTARALNQIVIEALSQAGLPVIAFPPSACVLAQAGAVQEWNLTPIRRALQAGLVPVVQGDVVFDETLGGTILSTEDLFFHLAPLLQPDRILLAGIEPGIWADFPARTQLINNLTPQTLPALRQKLRGSASTDVTGGMQAKVERMMSLLQSPSNLQIAIFSGLHPGLLTQALTGHLPGSVLSHFPLP
jgi:isopentenyl phosphate kinase